VSTKARVLLPGFAIFVAVILAIVANQQRPTGLQDSLPFVPPAMEWCEAINAPATFLPGALLLVADSTHFEQGFSRRPIPQILFLGGSHCSGSLWVSKLTRAYPKRCQ